MNGHGRTIALIVAVSTAAPLSAQEPRVLLVTAHPDDDAAFAGAVYQITHKLDGVVDLALVTDGSGGFRYATLAEPIYGLNLTDESIARQYLPAIRKRELMAGGAIVGIRKYFFFDELDHEYTQNADTVLRAVWDSASVRQRLQEIMEREQYDMVVGMLPFAQMHGHHKSATILALLAAREVDRARRPVVLGGFPCSLGDGQPIEFEVLDGFPITRVTGDQPVARFDRTQKFGYEDRLDFKIIANWVIAEHKSQGTMQLLVNQGDAECYWYFDVNDPGRRTWVSYLFDRLRVDP